MKVYTLPPIITTMAANTGFESIVSEFAVSCEREKGFRPLARSSPSSLASHSKPYSQRIFQNFITEKSSAFGLPAIDADEAGVVPYGVPSRTKFQ